MPLQIPAIAAAAAVETVGILKQSYERRVQGEPDYIRSGQPLGVIPTLALEGARRACRRYGRNPDGLPDAKAAQYEAACRPYLDSISEGSGPLLDGGIGGQCPGQLYSVRWETRANDTAAWQSRTPIQVYGPITGRRFVQTSTSPLVTTAFVDGRNASGDPATFTGTNGNAVRNCRWTEIRTLPPGGDPTLCGTTPVVVTPPTVPVDPPGPRFSVTLAPSFTIDASVDVDISTGDLTIDFGDGPTTVDPFADDGDGGGGTGRPPGDVGAPGSPDGTGPGGEAEGEAPEGKVLTGLKIDFESPPVGGKEYAPGVYRGVCYVYMGTDKGLDHDPAGAMLRNGQFIFAERDNLTRWRVSANLGYDLRVTPYYADVEV